MDSTRRGRRAARGRGARALGRPVVGTARGGASDASHLAATIPVAVDGLGPRGGKAHNPGEYVLAATLHERAEVALAVILAGAGGLSRGAGQAVTASTASDSSSRGRRSTMSSPDRRSSRTAATPPFLKSTRPPVRS